MSWQLFLIAALFFAAGALTASAVLSKGKKKKALKERLNNLCQ